MTMQIESTTPKRKKKSLETTKMKAKPATKVKPVTKKAEAEWPETATSLRYRHLGFKEIILPAGPLRYVNVAARLLKLNLEEPRLHRWSDHLPVVTVRKATHPEAGAAEVYDGVEILGSCEIPYTPEDPLPSTGGRGIAYMRTTAAIRCWLRPSSKIAPTEASLP